MNLPVSEKLNTTSFSRIETYSMCGEFYRRKYVLNERPPEELKDYFLMGSVVHEILQEFFDPKTETASIDDAIVIALPKFISQLNIQADPDLIHDLGNEMSNLMYRASNRYSGPDAIRTKDGGVPKNLKSMPPQSWTQAMKASGMDKLKLKYDNAAVEWNPLFVSTSFTYFLGEIFFLTRYLVLPEYYSHTMEVELPVSTEEFNKVLFPGENDLYLNGYIDWIFKTTDGLLVISDHKTSKSEPSSVDVLHHPQLNLYAYAYNQLFGYYPDLIGINHLRSGKLILAEVDTEVLQANISYYKTLSESIKKQVFPKSHPQKYNSPCIKKDFLTGQNTELCPYLESCWKTYYESLAVEDELKLTQFF